jgi:hypothetical protein
VLLILSLTFLQELVKFVLLNFLTVRLATLINVFNARLINFSTKIKSALIFIIVYQTHLQTLLQELAKLVHLYIHFAMLVDRLFAHNV